MNFLISLEYYLYESCDPKGCAEDESIKDRRCRAWICGFCNMGNLPLISRGRLGIFRPGSKNWAQVKLIERAALVPA